MAVFAQFVADFHGLVSMYQNTVSIPFEIYLIIGMVGEPILIVSALMVSLGFWGAWEKYKNKWARIICYTFLIYSLERCFWAYADINFVVMIQNFAIIQDPAQTRLAGMLLGLAALLAGITAGVAISIEMAVYFHQMNDRQGFHASILILIAMIAGMISKILSMYLLPMMLTVVFLIAMGTKSVGLGLIGINLYRYSKE
jgi:hypothetical protein